MLVNPVRSQRQTGTSRGRPRSTENHRAILNATKDMLREVGYFEMSIEGIADRANVGKPTVYRWWPSKAYLAMEVITEFSREQPPLPDTGSLRSDLTLLLKYMSRGMEGKTSTAFNGLIAEAQVDKDLERRLHEFIELGKNAVVLVLQRGRERGEIAEDLDLNVLADLIYGSKWYKFILNPKPIDDDFGKQLVEIILRLRH